MAIALRGTPQSGVNGAGSSVTVSVPSGVVNGDLLIAWITHYHSNSTIVDSTDTPTGWTRIGAADAKSSGGGSNAGVGLFWRIASSEPASYSLSFTRTTDDNYVDAAILAYSGASSTQFNLTSQSKNANTTTASTTDLGSTTVDNCWHVLIFGTYDGLGASITGYTKDLDFDGATQQAYHKLISPAGATGSQSVSNSNTNGWVSWALAIAPPAVAASMIPQGRTRHDKWRSAAAYAANR